MNKSYLSQQILEIDCRGNGETQHQAVEESFKDMREKLTKQFQWPIISLQTIDYIVKDIQKTEREEAFLYLFMKRTRIYFEIEVTIKVQIDYVNIEGGN